MSQFGNFKITMPIVKVFSENGKRFIVGVSSSTDIDLTNERMDASAIKTMADSIKGRDIPLKSEHENKWDSVLGTVVDLSVSKDNELTTKAELKDTNKADDLFKELTAGTQLGFSIGGIVKDFTFEDVEGKGRIKTYKDISLEEISIVAHPANPKTWVEAIAKSVKDALPVASVLDILKQPFMVQTLIFSKDAFDREQAVAWAEAHDFRSDKVDETENSWRLRQEEPASFIPDSFRTIDLADGVQAVIGRKPMSNETAEDIKDAPAVPDEAKEAETETSKNDEQEKKAEPQPDSLETKAPVEAPEATPQEEKVTPETETTVTETPQTDKHLELITNLTGLVEKLTKELTEVRSEVAVIKSAPVGRKGIVADKFAPTELPQDERARLAKAEKAEVDLSKLASEDKFLKKQAIDRKFGLQK